MKDYYDNLGPSLERFPTQACRMEMRLGRPHVSDDVRAKQIQETGQEQRPARMVGPSYSDSARTDMEVGRSDRAKISTKMRPGEEG